MWEIGANIGAASLYFSHGLSRARIHAVEPVPDNFRLAERNLAAFPVTLHDIAFGPQDTEVPIAASDFCLDVGGFSLHYSAAATAPVFQVRMARLQTLLDRGMLPLDPVEIETEGVERDGLTAFPRDMLAAVAWMIGELRSVRSFELLEYLSGWFFIETRKSMESRLFMFTARSRSLR